MLEIKDLTVRYGKQEPTVESFQLSMKKGEIVSIVGCLLYTSPSPRD